MSICEIKKIFSTSFTINCLTFGAKIAQISKLHGKRFERLSDTHLRINLNELCLNKCFQRNSKKWKRGKKLIFLWKIKREISRKNAS